MDVEDDHAVRRSWESVLDLELLRRPEPKAAQHAVAVQVEVDVGLASVQADVVVQRRDGVLPRMLDDRVMRMALHGRANVEDAERRAAWRASAPEASWAAPSPRRLSAVEVRRR